MHVYSVDTDGIQTISHCLSSIYSWKDAGGCCRVQSVTSKVSEVEQQTINMDSRWSELDQQKIVECKSGGSADDANNLPRTAQHAWCVGVVRLMCVRAACDLSSCLYFLVLLARFYCWSLELGGLYNRCSLNFEAVDNGWLSRFSRLPVGTYRSL